MQDRERFTQEIEDSVQRLPSILNFSEELNDFILRIMKLRSSERPVTKAICLHPWLDGVFEEEWSALDVLASPMYSMKARTESFASPSVGSLPTESPVIDVNMSHRERHMVEQDTEKSGLQFHLPPLEPKTPSVGRARKLLNPTNDFASPKHVDASASRNRFSEPLQAPVRDEGASAARIPADLSSVKASKGVPSSTSVDRNSTQSDRTDGELESSPRGESEKEREDSPPVLQLSRRAK